MEEFFYIILLIIWVAVSFFKKKKAKQQQSSAPAKRQEPKAEPVENELDLEELLGEFLGGGSSKARPSAAGPAKPDTAYAEEFENQSHKKDVGQADYASQDNAPRTVYEESSVPETYDQMYQDYQEELGVKEDFEFSAEGEVQTIEDLIRSHARKDALLQAQAEMEERRQQADGDVPPFDLKTAVVFSEILNRKYN